jgi:UDP-N-acetyl-D-galactosamine dehydrogenase
VRELENYGFEVQVADPMAYPEEAEHEYGIRITPVDKLKPAHGVVFAVAHKGLREGGWGLVKGLLADGKGVVVDVKGVLPRGEKPGGVELWRL